MENNLIAGIGEVLWDIFPEYKQLGGATANFAYHTSQFGFNATVVSALGCDPLGDEIEHTLNTKKVNHLLSKVEYPTGTVHVTVDSEGVPCYDIRQGVAWDHIPYTDQMRDLARQCCAVCFGSLAQRNEESRATIARFLDDTPEEALRIFDINLRQNFYTHETLLNSLRKCNVLKLNEDEVVVLAQIFGYEGLNPRAVCRAVIKDYALQVVILTCGASGSYVFTPRRKLLLRYSQSQGSRYGRRRRFVYRNILCCTAPRQTDPDCAPFGCRCIGLCLHPTGRYAHTARRVASPARSG